MSESTFSFTTKIHGDLLTVRGDTIEEFTFNAGELAASLEAISALQEAVKDIMGVTTHTDAVKAVQASTGATVVSDTVAGVDTPEVVQDKWGNTWTYGAPGAPVLPDGRGHYALKQGTSKAGKPYKAWMDPVKGPRPFPAGDTEAKIIWV